MKYKSNRLENILWTAPSQHDFDLEPLRPRNQSFNPNPCQHGSFGGSFFRYFQR